MSKQYLSLLQEVSVFFLHFQLHYSMNKAPAFIQRTEDWFLLANTAALTTSRFSYRNTSMDKFTLLIVLKQTWKKKYAFFARMENNYRDSAKTFSEKMYKRQFTFRI